MKRTSEPKTLMREKLDMKRVLFFEPLRPNLPELHHDKTFPSQSEKVTIVLLKDVLI